MDISMLRNRAREFKDLLASASVFQKNNQLSKANPEVVQLGRGIALLLIAILCAWMGKMETEKNTRLRVLQEEWPAPAVWFGVLKEKGWTRVESADFSGLLKNHPDPFSTQTAIWETEDHCLLFLTQSPYPKSSNEVELWSCATSHNKPHGNVKWHKIGSGYSGLNLLSQISLPEVKKAASYIDPKEIRY